jgi:hypothetical protein
MHLTSALYPEEFASLQEMAKGYGQCSTLPAHVSRLLALGLIYMPLETPRITPAGMARLANGI